MAWLTIVLRFLHVVSGALWVGMFAFTAVFLTPALQELGPDGAKIGPALQRRRLMVIMPLLALVTLSSGMWLFARFSGGSMATAMATGPGLAFALGGAAALLAFVVGILGMRPIMMRTVELMKNPGANAAELARLRTRGATISRVVAVLLFVALAAMAVARYV